MSLVIFCLLFSLVDYVPVKGEIIWYLSLTAWLIPFVTAWMELESILLSEISQTMFLILKSILFDVNMDTSSFLLIIFT